LSSGGGEWTQYVKIHATAQPERQLWTFPGALTISPYLLGPVYANPKHFTDQQQKLVSQRSSWRHMQHQMRRWVHIPQNAHVKKYEFGYPFHCRVPQWRDLGWLTLCHADLQPPRISGLARMDEQMSWAHAAWCFALLGLLFYSILALTNSMHSY